MARFDVYELAGGGLAIDCQADFLSDIATRFVVPLTPLGEGPPPNPKLNPQFDVDGERLVMTTQFATSVRVRELRKRVSSLDHEHLRIISAIDMLMGTG